MSRNPSLHITESRLIIVLQEVLPNKGPLRWEYDKLAQEICNKAKTHSAASRSISVTNNKLEKKVLKMKLASRSDTAIFAQMLLLLRRQMKHRGLVLIQPGQKEWFELKETCKLATDFCNEFQIGLKEGYKEYLSIGLNKMKNFSIHKFKTIHAAICNEYEATQIIKQDPTPNETRQCHDIYMGIISDKIGYSSGYENLPDKYKHFVDVKKEAKKFGVSYKVYLKSQFEGFEWNNSVPDPAQLVGTKAVDRLQKYCYANSIQLGEKRGNINFNNIKRGNHNRK